jgi:UPF0271 protein
MVQSNAIETTSGKMIPTLIDSICLHSDTPTAVSIAKSVRQGLESAGVALKAFAPVVAQ